MKLLTTTENGPQAELICARLRAAGISALTHGVGLAAYTQESGAREVYVEDADLDRARELLESSEGIDEEELVRAEEAAAAAPRTRIVQPMGMDPRTGRPFKPIEVQVDKRSVWDKLFRRGAKGPQ